jgi:hypothetical protein
MADPKDNWQRSKECADMAERTYDRNIANSERARSHSIYSSHYSPKYDRCFLLVVSSADVNDMAAGIFFQITALIDALENLRWATEGYMVHAKQREDYCHLGDKQAPCSAARDYINEHMAN